MIVIEEVVVESKLLISQHRDWKNCIISQSGKIKVFSHSENRDKKCININYD